MLVDLFKPAWKSSAVEKRLKAVSMMDSSPDKQQVLIELAVHDDDASVRIAAIQRIDAIDQLHEMSLSPAADQIVAEAEKRVNELLSSSRSMNQQLYQDLLTRYPELKLRIAAHADAASIRSESLINLNSEQLLEVLGATVFSDTRQLIAEQLSDIDALESARKIMRGKDKNAERIIKTKIDELRKIERQNAENLASVEKLCDEVEYLSTHDWLPEFKGRCVAHCKQWDSLDFEIASELRQRYQTSREILDTRFEQQRIIEQTTQAQQQRVAELKALLQQVAARNFSDANAAVSETRSTLDKLSTDWRQLATILTPEISQQKPFDEMQQAMQSALQLTSAVSKLLAPVAAAEPAEPTEPNSTQSSADNTNEISLASRIQRLHNALKNLHWPKTFGMLQLAGECEQQLNEWRDAQQAAVAEKEQKLATAHKNISAIFRFARGGNLGRAKQLCERAEKALAPFSGKDLLALQERLAEAQKTLGDMGDWKNFATEPKYIELCDSMEALVTSKLHPDKLSSAMKELQQQWKSLGHSDISDQYWERFKKASDLVYKPCADFFDQRHQTRQSNLQQRQQIVEQLRELQESTDWDNSPDYRAIQASLYSISDHFATIKDVERKEGQQQWKQFVKHKDAIMARLDVVYSANLELKQQLIKQTSALAEAEVKEENLNALKSLQNRWKQVGITRRNQDQKAWTEFKKQGDLVYNRVQELRQGQRDETDQQLNAYRNIIKQIQQLARSATELAAADQQFSALQEQYSALPELPRQLPEKLLEGLQRDYRNACDQFDQCHSRIIGNLHNQQLDALRQKAELCSQLEALGPSADEQKLQKLNAEWDAITLQDAELSRRIEARRSAAQSTLDRTAIGEERRMLCIRLEITLGAETPAEDKALRMQYQLDQMNKLGLGHQSIDNSALLESMQLDWLCLPGAESGLQKKLDKRFHQVLAKR